MRFIFQSDRMKGTINFFLPVSIVLIQYESRISLQIFHLINGFQMKKRKGIERNSILTWPCFFLESTIHIENRGFSILDFLLLKDMETPADLRSMIEQTLTMIITPDQQLIDKGQTQLQTLELLDKYTLALTEITVDSSRDISIRQLAGVLLRKYVNKHWTKDIDNFVEPEVPEQVDRE